MRPHIAARLVVLVIILIVATIAADAAMTFIDHAREAQTAAMQQVR